MTKQPDWHRHVINNVLPRMEASTAPATGFQQATAADFAPVTFYGDRTPNDPAELLEGLPLALVKWTAIKQRALDLHGSIPSFEAIREVQLEKFSHANRISELMKPKGEGGPGLSEDAPQIATVRKQMQRAEQEFARLSELKEVRTARWNSVGSLARNVSDWLLQGGVSHGCVIEAVEIEEPKLLKNEGLLDGVARLQRRTREVKADIHRVRSACYTETEALALVNATVENWGSNGIDTSATIEHLSQPTIPTKTVQAMVHNVPGAPAAVCFVEVPDVAAIFSTVLKNQFIAWLAADVGRNADPKGALSHEARQQQEAELMGDLLAIERDECALVWQAQAQGLPVEHRADISPLALLGLRLVTAPRGETPGTSPEQAITFAGGRR
jgi:hypothetical protein